MLAEQESVDNAAVTAFSSAMRKKLAASRAKGRYGWQDPDLCPTSRLSDMLVEHLSKGNSENFLDIAILAMMLHERGEDPAILRSSLEAGIPERVEPRLVRHENGHPVWRVEVGPAVADFNDETPARLMAEAINARSSVPAIKSAPSATMNPSYLGSVLRDMGLTLLPRTLPENQIDEIMWQVNRKRGPDLSRADVLDAYRGICAHLSGLSNKDFASRIPSGIHHPAIEIVEAMQPFVTFGIGEDNDGDIMPSLMRDRIKDWFGQGEFLAIRRAYNMATGRPITENLPYEPENLEADHA